MLICGDCRYIKSITTLKGDPETICKCHPPHVVAGTENGKTILLSRWPIVRRNDEACGDFYAKER